MVVHFNVVGIKYVHYGVGAVESQCEFVRVREVSFPNLSNVVGVEGRGGIWLGVGVVLKVM